MVGECVETPAMRNGMDQPPRVQRREREEIGANNVGEVGQGIGNGTGRRKGARDLNDILVCSYARGDWVGAPTAANQYKSDYDILVIVSQKELTDRAAYWTKAEERLIRDRKSTRLNSSH